MSIIPFKEITRTKRTNLPSNKSQTTAFADFSVVQSTAPKTATALVYCEGNFGKIDGKTANGLVRHSEKYKILSVIDSLHTGADAGEVLDQKSNAIPIFENLAEAFANAPDKPNYFIYGMAPATGMLSRQERKVVLDAMRLGMNVINGLHEFLNDDPEFVAACREHNVEITDIRKPRAKNELRLFAGDIHNVACPRIAVLGTDCAIGKRTTANILTKALAERGINAVLVTTGQTGMIQGSRYGVALDAVPSQFCCGELEATIVEAYKGDAPDIIIVEGQGALSHPAFCTSAFILRGSAPHAVILQHAPKREYRCDFDLMKMPSAQSEVKLIEAFADTQVIGLTLNHENMSDMEVSESITKFSKQLNIPVTDALSRSSEMLVDMVFMAFPKLAEKSGCSVQ